MSHVRQLGDPKQPRFEVSLTWEGGQKLAIGQVTCADLDLLQLIQYIKLCEVESSVAIN